MGLRDRVKEVAKSTAQQVADRIFALRLQQLTQQTAGLATVDKVEGNNLTVKINGKKVTVTNAGQRIFGPGDPVITDGQSFAL